MKRFSAVLLVVLVFSFTSSQFSALAQDSATPPQGVTASGDRIQIEGNGATIVLEPYAENILRVTLSLNHDPAVAGPGYGVIAHAAGSGWSAKYAPNSVVYSSSRMVVTAGIPQHWNSDKSTIAQAGYFVGTTPWTPITFKTPDGTTLIDMRDWSQSVLNQKDGTAQIAADRRPTDDEFYTVGATFASPDDEHYYGLGQNQEGYLDHRGHAVHCWADYEAPAAPTFCVPFVVTNKGYGLLWDNPSKTTFEGGFNGQTKWTSQAGDRVSFFVIAGKNADEIYAGYRLLTGPTPMMPKAAYGYIQCKQRYSSQAELLGVAKGYRDRHLPADVLVVDWFYYTNMGQMDFDPKAWPDPKKMNDELHAMGFETMISVWPRFVPTDRFYAEVLKNKWFIAYADGKPIDGLPYDRAGSDIDTTNPDAAKWYWNTVRDNIIAKGFDSLWADETEPDLPPNGAYMKIGPGTEYFNVYPLFHTAALYDGMRRDEPGRALILSRDAYLGSQRNGTITWSSDIYPTWDTLKRQIPTGLNVTASGIAYWSNDTGGWQAPAPVHHPAHKPLLDPSDARDNVGYYDDYPELYTRWFQYATFLPVMRTHGSRKFNEVWSYGHEAEPILEKYLCLRYELMPYIYSLGYQTWLTGAPFMRALALDFPGDPKVADMGDEYMFGPAFLVAPITDQGQTTKQVYLPAGTDWYNYWTGERIKGGQTVAVSAPIDTIPLFVKAGSIIPLGSAIENTHQKQAIAKVKVFPGADASFTLFQDDGTTYAYENGGGQVTRLHWDDAGQKLTSEGPAAWTAPDSSIVEIEGR